MDLMILTLSSFALIFILCLLILLLLVKTMNTKLRRKADMDQIKNHVSGKKHHI
ncbi:MAG: hypothetical protein WCK29_03010 [archaeon]